MDWWHEREKGCDGMEKRKQKKMVRSTEGRQVREGKIKMKVCTKENRKNVKERIKLVELHQHYSIGRNKGREKIRP